MKKKKKPPSHRTVKCSLKSILRNNDNYSPLINELVIRCNTIITESYQFIRLYCLYKYHNNEPIPEITEKFILYCIKSTGVRDNRGRKPENDTLESELRNFYENQYKQVLTHEKHDLKNLSYLLPYLATQMHTAIHNNLKEHFIKRLIRFINKTTSDTDDKIDKNKLKRCVLENSNDIPEKYTEWYNKYRKYILPETVDKTFYYDVKVHPSKYIQYSFFMNSVLEEQEYKLFQPLSLRNTIVPHYITFDTASLINLFADKGTKGNLLKAIKDNQERVWNTYFNLDKRIFHQKNYRFNYTMQTDGVGVSLLFVHKQYSGKRNCPTCDTQQEYNFDYIEDLPKEELSELEDKNIIGCDPGKYNLLYMSDGNKKLRYTAFQRRTESLSKRNSRIIYNEKVKNNIIEKETLLSEHNSKTVNYDKFKNYLIEKNKMNETVKDFYHNPLFRKLKWRQFVYTQKSEDKFLNKIEDTFGKNICLAYGDWSRKSQMKHFIPTKGVGLRKLIEKRYQTVSINEYKTSKLCCNCHKELSFMKIDNSKVFRCLVCKGCESSESKQTTFLTRDLNSSLNIRNITLEWIREQTRPSAFNRVVGLTHTIKGKNELIS